MVTSGIKQIVYDMGYYRVCKCFNEYNFDIFYGKNVKVWMTQQEITFCSGSGTDCSSTLLTFLCINFLHLSVNTSHLLRSKFIYKMIIKMLIFLFY